MLEDRGREWQQRFPRLADELPAAAASRPTSRSKKSNSGTWSARWAACCATRECQAASSIVYDETPIHVYIEPNLARLRERGRRGVQRFVPAGAGTNR